MSENELNLLKLVSFVKTRLGQTLGFGLLVIVIGYGSIYFLSNSYSTYDECVVHKMSKITNTEVARVSAPSIRRICEKECPFPFTTNPFLTIGICN